MLRGYLVFTNSEAFGFGAAKFKNRHDRVSIGLIDIPCFSQFGLNFVKHLAENLSNKVELERLRPKGSTNRGMTQPSFLTLHLSSDSPMPNAGDLHRLGSDQHTSPHGSAKSLEGPLFRQLDAVPLKLSKV